MAANSICHNNFAEANYTLQTIYEYGVISITRKTWAASQIVLSLEEVSFFLDYH